MDREKELPMIQKRILATNDLGVIPKKVQNSSKQNAQKVAQYESRSPNTAIYIQYTDYEK